MSSKNKNFVYVALLLLLSILLISIFGMFVPAQTKKENRGDRKQETPILAGQEEVKFADDSEHLVDNNTLYEKNSNKEVKTMYLTVNRGNDGENTNHTWAEINGHSAYYYERKHIERYKIAALLQVGDEKGPQVGQLGYGEVVPNATVQIRGQTSSRNAQKNYKIELKKNKGTWNEQTTINLNKHQADGLRFRNKLAFSLLEDIPQLLSLRTQFVHLYVKDKTGATPDKFVDYGLYTQVEQLNKTGMRAHGLDYTGQLYKVNFFEFMDPDQVIRLETDKKFNRKAFEKLLEIKGSDNHQKLIDLIKRINDNSQDFDTILNEYFDSENLSYWMAFQILIGNQDTQNRNFYLYSPLNSKRWYIIPWDHDGAFYIKEDKLEHKRGTSWERGMSNYWGNLLFRRALKTKRYRKALDTAIEHLRAKYLTRTKISNLTKQLSKTVAPYVAKRPDNIFLGFTPAQYQEVLKGLPAEVEMNYKTYKESYMRPMPFFISTPEESKGKLKLAWESAYTFGEMDITYTVEIARNYNFAKPIFKKENLKDTIIEMPFPKATGQYFIRVVAKNKAGKTQDAFDYYVVDNNKISGVKSFFIHQKRKITEDKYEEK